MTLKKSAKPIVEFMQTTIRNDLNARMLQMAAQIGLPKILAALEKLECTGRTI